MSPYKELSQTLRIPDSRGRGAALQPAGPRQRGRESARSAASRAGLEPQRHGRAAAAAGCLRRRRRAERADPIRRAARQPGASRSDHLGTALPPAAPTPRAGAGRGRRGGRAAGPLSRRRADRCGGTEPAGRRSGAAPLRGLCGRHLFGRPHPAADATGAVRVHVAEARGFVAASAQRYDLIQVALLDSFSASSAGLYALSENYLYTVEALQDALRHLQPGGLLAITRWVTLPPRDALKLFGAAVVALQRSGVADPGLAARAGAQLADEHAARQERRLQRRGHRRDQDLLRGALVRCGLLSRHAAAGGEPLQRGRAPRPVRRRDGLAGSGPGRVPERLQVPHRPGQRRQAALLPLLQVALVARAAVAEGAGRLAAAGMGLSGARRRRWPRRRSRACC